MKVLGENGMSVLVDEIKRIRHSVESNSERLETINPTYIEGTYAEIKALADAGQLISGTTYIINDYQYLCNNENVQNNDSILYIILRAVTPSQFEDMVKWGVMDGDKMGELHGNAKYVFDNAIDGIRIAFLPENHKGLLYAFQLDGKIYPYLPFATMHFNQFTHFCHDGDKLVKKPITNLRILNSFLTRDFNNFIKLDETESVVCYKSDSDHYYILGKYGNNSEIKLFSGAKSARCRIKLGGSDDTWIVPKRDNNNFLFAINSSKLITKPNAFFSVADDKINQPLFYDELIINGKSYKIVGRSINPQTDNPISLPDYYYYAYKNDDGGYIVFKDKLECPGIKLIGRDDSHYSILNPGFFKDGSTNFDFFDLDYQKIDENMAKHYVNIYLNYCDNYANEINITGRKTDLGILFDFYANEHRHVILLTPDNKFLESDVELTSDPFIDAGYTRGNVIETTTMTINPEKTWPFLLSVEDESVEDFGTFSLEHDIMLSYFNGHDLPFLTSQAEGSTVETFEYDLPSFNVSYLISSPNKHLGGDGHNPIMVTTRINSGWDATYSFSRNFNLNMIPSIFPNINTVPTDRLVPNCNMVIPKLSELYNTHNIIECKLYYIYHSQNASSNIVGTTGKWMLKTVSWRNPQACRLLFNTPQQNPASGIRRLFQTSGGSFCYETWRTTMGINHHTTVRYSGHYYVFGNCPMSICR